MKYNEKKHKYESGAFSDADENSGLATGGKDRMLAAAEMHKAFPQSHIIPMSRTRDDTKPTYAKVTRDELISKGVDEGKIHMEEESVNTITEFKEAIRRCLSNNWSNIVFISSNWHLPRTQALFNHIEDFSDNEEERDLFSRFVRLVIDGKIIVQFLGSTDVLSPKDYRYKMLFDAVEHDPGILERKELEAKALQQIKEGTYGNRTLTHKIWEGKE